MEILGTFVLIGEAVAAGLVAGFRVSDLRFRIQQFGV
jgi:hypothetical protein